MLALANLAMTYPVSLEPSNFFGQQRRTFMGKCWWAFLPLGADVADSVRFVDEMRFPIASFFFARERRTSYCNFWHGPWLRGH